MAGDFGEILAYYLFKELYEKRGVDGPMKWRWKENKDAPIQGTDVVLFSVDPEHSSKDDLLLSVESKVKATKSKMSPIEDAYNDASKDYTSRLATSLAWLRAKAKKEALKGNGNEASNKLLVAKLNRFIQSEHFGEYQKESKAIAFIDKKYVDEELDKTIEITTDPDLPIEVYVVGIKELKKLYEDAYSEMKKI